MLTPPRLLRHLPGLLPGLFACLLLATRPAPAQDSAHQLPTDTELPGASLSLPALEAPPRVEGGWDGLARALDSLKPEVDTRVPPTASQITDQIEALLNAGKASEALAAIKARLAVEQDRRAPGADVQLAFLHARALAATGDAAGAEREYDAMTRAYPELPEPWNNLAALYVQKNQLERAQHALQTAVSLDARYGLAQANLADLHLLFAQRAAAAAAALGVADAARQARAIQSLLERP